MRFQTPNTKITAEILARFVRIWNLVFFWCLVFGVSCFFTSLSFADSVVLSPVADTALIELVPTNNMGGETYFISGSNMHGQRNRGLVRFDFSGIPSGSKIDAATFSVRVVQVPTDGPADSIFDLHRVLQPWGEGDKLSNSSGAGRGSPATTNEATWLDRFAFAGAPWSSPGGEATNDFVAESSAEQFVVDVGSSPYNFSSAQLVSDLQLWLDNPAINFGWLLKTRDETTPSTARRFGSREDDSNRPQLEIYFTPPPPPPPPQITDVKIEGGRFLFQFSAKAGRSYALQSSDNLSNAESWVTFGVLDRQPFDTIVLVSDSLSEARKFYRVASH